MKLNSSILEVNPNFCSKNFNKPDKEFQVQNQNKNIKTSFGQKVDIQDYAGQNVVKLEIKKENDGKTNKKLLLSLGGLAVIAAAGLLVGRGIIRKQHIQELFESINSTKNNINENINRINDNFKAVDGRRPVRNNWATNSQNDAMNNIESIMRYVNGCFDSLAEKYNKLTTLIMDPARKKEIQIEAINDKIAQVKLNIDILENIGYVPTQDSFAPIGCREKYNEISKLQSLLDKLEKELASLQK